MIALAALAIVAIVALAAIAACVFLQGRNASQTSALLAAMAAERYSAARERWDLNTRISSPEVVRAAPPAPPADVPPAEVLRALNVLQPVAEEEEEDEDFDETFLVGTGPDAA